MQQRDAFDLPSSVPRPVRRPCTGPAFSGRQGTVPCLSRQGLSCWRGTPFRSIPSRHEKLDRVSWQQVHCAFNRTDYRIRREDLHHITEAYRFYLSIKQLSDDAHDWESDIENDIQTFVTEIVIGELEKRSIHEKDPKAAEGPEPDVVSKETMRDIFLGKALPIVYEKTVEYSKGAYMHLDLLSCMQSTGFIRSEIERYCHAAWQALCESRAFHPDLHRDDGAASNAT